VTLRYRPPHPVLGVVGEVCCDISNDHRTVLGGILWVVGSAAYGKWETAYKRYRLWRETGLWQRILEALSEGGN
jgi:hypothetical protein